MAKTMAKTMKKCFGLALAMLMLMLAGTGMLAVQAEDNNLLVNGSFEELKGSGNPENWTIANESAVVVKEGDTGYVASPNGGKYMRLSKNNALIQQETNGAVASGNYLFSGYVKYAFAEAPSNSSEVGALVTFYCYGENGTMVIPQSKDNNYPIYSTRGEWRRFAFIISVPEGNTKILCALRHSNGINVTDLCYDGVSFERVGDYDPDTLIQYNMEDVAKYNNVDVPTDMVVYSAYNNVEDTSAYGTLGVNYKATANTPDGSAYAMEMDNKDGAVSNGLGMVFFTGTLEPLAVYEVTGYINVESADNSGYATIVTGREQMDSTNTSYKKETHTFYNTNGWKKFSFNLIKDWRLLYNSYPANIFNTANGMSGSLEGVALDNAPAGEFANSYKAFCKIFFNGKGSVKLDDIRITRLSDGNRIGYGNNLAVGGDFESIGEMTKDGVAKPNDAFVLGQNKSTWTNDKTVANGVMLETETLADNTTNTYLRISTNKTDKEYLNLKFLHMVPGKLYKVTWRQKKNEAGIGSVMIYAVSQKLFFKDSNDERHDYKKYYDNNASYSGMKTDWAWYTQYIRFTDALNPENMNIYFRPTIQADTVFYLDDISVCMVEEEELYGGTPSVSVVENAAVVARTFFNDGITSASLNTAKTYTIATASYIKDGTTKKLFDVRVGSVTTTNADGSKAVNILVPAGEKASQTVAIPETGEYEIETFVWEGIGTLKPLAGKATIK